MLTFVFWFSVFAIIYAYIGYPLSLWALNKTSLRKRFLYSKPYAEFYPYVYIIIAAANEEDKIQAKLDNTLALNYLPKKLQILVASDASTDNTDDIVKRYELATEGLVKLIRLPKKGGKEAAQKAAIETATGDVIVFTDAATILEPESLNQIVGNFYDDRIGGVDGMSKVLGNGGEGAYLKYENKIREWEAQLGSTVSFGGCLFAVRQEMLSDFSPSLQSDFRSALQTVTHGKQAIIDTKAVATFADTKDSSKEYSRKHRTVVRGINNLFNHLYLLNPCKYGLFAYQLFCHKLLKWLVPFFMLSALISNMILLGFSPPSLWWGLVMFVQFNFYLVSGVAWDMKFKQTYLKIPAFFVMSNMAILHAWFSYYMGERFVTWKPTER